MMRQTNNQNFDDENDLPLHQESAPLSFLPSLLYTTMTIIGLMLSFLPRKIQVYLSTMMIGGLFGVMVPPLIIWHFTLKWIKNNFVIYLWTDVTEKFFWVTVYSVVFTCYFLSVYRENTFLFSRRNPNRGTIRTPKNWAEERSLSFWLSHFSYFPLSVTIPSPKDENDRHNGNNEEQDGNSNKQQQYIFAVHPHGIHCWALSLFCLLGSPLDETENNLFHHIVRNKKNTGLCANVLFWIPAVRELFYTMGYVPASRPIAQSILDLPQKKSIFVCTGGEEEAMLTKKGEDFYLLQKRKGFVRLSIQYGASLVPVLAIENNDLFYTYPNTLKSLRFWVLRHFGLAFPIFHGRFWVSPLPISRPLHVVIGSPIPIAQRHVALPADRSKPPPPEIVDLYHMKYIEAVKELHKLYGNGRPLHII